MFRSDKLEKVSQENIIDVFSIIVINIFLSQTICFNFFKCSQKHFFLTSGILLLDTSETSENIMSKYGESMERGVKKLSAIFIAHIMTALLVNPRHPKVKLPKLKE